MLELSIISDEISHHLPEAIQFAQENEIDYLELRSVNGINLIDLEINEIKLYYQKMREARLKSFCYPSSLFKCLPTSQTQRIQKTFEIAKILECKYIRIFSYLKSEDFSIEKYADELAHWNEFAKKEDQYLLLENEPSCNIQTFKDLSGFLNKYRFSRVQAVPDLGNQTEVLPGFDRGSLLGLIPFSPCIHIKDYSLSQKCYVNIGEGDSFIQDSLELFRGIQTMLTLETHVRFNRKISSQISFNALKSWLKDKNL